MADLRTRDDCIRLRAKLLVSARPDFEVSCYVTVRRLLSGSFLTLRSGDWQYLGGRNRPISDGDLRVFQVDQSSKCARHTPLGIYKFSFQGFSTEWIA